MHAQAAHEHCLRLQEYLQLQLVALARRHPVPVACGSVLCMQLGGPSAVSVVCNRVGTLCGGCKQAMYRSKECQQDAWEDHTRVCRGPAVITVCWPLTGFSWLQLC